MLHIYTQFFEFLLDNEQQIREQIGEDWRQLYSVLQQDPSLATPDPASLEEFEKYLRRVIGYSLQSPIRGLVSQFLSQEKMLRNERLYLRPRPSSAPPGPETIRQVRMALSESSNLAAILATNQRDARTPYSFGLDLAIEDNLPARQIVVTGHSPATGELVDAFQPAQPYDLRFRVAANSTGNLASGEIDVTGVPAAGLDALWVATSANVEFASVTPAGKVERNGEGWMASFPLRIPGEGDSDTVTLNVKTTAAEGQIALALLVGGEQYRKATITLARGSKVTGDEVCITPNHLRLGTTHEWTTPPVHLEINVVLKKALVTTVRGSEEYGPFDWTASSATLDGPIRRVRAALEKFRAKAEKHLNNLDQADMEQRLRGSGWQMYHSWAPIQDQADPAHRQAMEALTAQPELRALAVEGYRLFDSCFPSGSGLRTLLESLPPGSRVNFAWTSDMAVDWVSHVPWALMYLDPLKSTGTPDPERFLGLRLRIGSKAWEPKSPSRALGDPAQVNAVNFLYWGTNPRDEVAVESAWQRTEFAKWARQNFVPDSPAAPNPKQQVVEALETPAPPPAAVLYFFCHCSVKDGSEPQLQFGESAQSSEVLDASEIYTGRLDSGPLVFANACTTATADPQGSSELEQRFFARGIRAFIGTETRVPVKLASRFAWLFFQFFLRQVDPKPMPAGEALAQARMFLWTQYRNPGGLFYCLVNQYNLYLASGQDVAELQRS